MLPSGYVLVLGIFTALQYLQYLIFQLDTFVCVWADHGGGYRQSTIRYVVVLEQS